MLQRGHGLLQGLRDLRLDIFGAGAGVGGDDNGIGEVDLSGDIGAVLKYRVGFKTSGKGNMNVVHFHNYVARKFRDMTAFSDAASAVTA